MQEPEFRKAIKGLPISRAEYFSSIGSTNDVVAEWANQGAKGLCLAYADEQTMGRGRAGRTWFTPPGSALAFSVLLDRDAALETNLLGLTSGLGAVAVCEALESHNLKPRIKWPNDVLLDGKKVCGVLAEAEWSGDELQALILGIGINVAAQSVPPMEKLNFPATCIEEELGSEVVPSKLLRKVLESLIAWKDRVSKPTLVREWEKRLAYLGQSVHLDASEKSGEGEVLGLTPDGKLRMRLPDGVEHAFSIGEIQIRT
jgi:BirA family biotin operon repressor/biotin-[acetyl-CoA-carboxylase] ligase